MKGAHIVLFYDSADLAAAALPHSSALLGGQHAKRVCYRIAHSHFLCLQLLHRKFLYCQIVCIVFCCGYEHLHNVADLLWHSR